MRKIARTDGNHQDVIDEFRKCGCSVHSTHQLGNGFVDVVVGCSGLNFLVEIKDGSLVPSARQLTAPEKEFHDNWLGRTDIVEHASEVFNLVNQWRRIARAFQQFYRGLE